LYYSCVLARPRTHTQETEAIAIDLVRHILFLHARRAPFHKKDMKEVIRDRHAPRTHLPLLKRASEVRLWHAHTRACIRASLSLSHTHVFVHTIVDLETRALVITALALHHDFT
jgi:hypothetical protein